MTSARTHTRPGWADRAVPAGRAAPSSGPAPGLGAHLSSAGDVLNGEPSGSDPAVSAPSGTAGSTTPRRVRLRRIKGWRKPEGAVVVARPSRWGNPFVVKRAGAARFVSRDGWPSVFAGMDDASARALAVEKYREALLWSWSWNRLVPFTIEQVRNELAGRDLCCWCPLDQPCHADVLLELANREAD